MTGVISGRSSHDYRGASLTHLLSVTAPHLWFPLIIFFQSFPFPPIVQINSTLHQPVSHGNLLTSSPNTLFLFLRFLFCSSSTLAPSTNTHSLTTSNALFLALCCLPSFLLLLSQNFDHESKKKKKTFMGVF